MATDGNSIGALLISQRDEVLSGWIRAQLAGSTYRPQLMSEAELRAESGRLLDLLDGAWSADPSGSTDGPAWESVRDQLTELSRSRAVDGYSPSETATFVFSIKQPIFEVLRKSSSGDELAARFCDAATVIDRLG
jgi:rsbT co-antagonist protein RsbR